MDFAKHGKTALGIAAGMFAGQKLAELLGKQISDPKIQGAALLLGGMAFKDKLDEMMQGLSEGLMASGAQVLLVTLMPPALPPVPVSGLGWVDESQFGEYNQEPLSTNLFSGLGDLGILAQNNEVDMGSIVDDLNELKQLQGIGAVSDEVIEGIEGWLDDVADKINGLGAILDNPERFELQGLGDLGAYDQQVNTLSQKFDRLQDRWVKGADAESIINGLEELDNHLNGLAGRMGLLDEDMSGLGQIEDMVSGIEDEINGIEDEINGFGDLNDDINFLKANGITGLGDYKEPTF